MVAVWAESRECDAHLYSVAHSWLKGDRKFSNHQCQAKVLAWWVDCERSLHHESTKNLTKLISASPPQVTAGESRPPCSISYRVLHHLSTVLHAGRRSGR
jgi:hypothetical protein